MNLDDPNARPSLAERYSIAVGRGTSQQHMILAAGMQHERLGAMLLRLRCEYDNIRGDLERAGEIAPQASSAIDNLSRRAEFAKRLGDFTAAAILLEAAGSLKKRSVAETLTARAIILIGMKSLHATKERFSAFAINLAVQPKRSIKPSIAGAIAGQVLDVWLDPTCHTCDGTGHTGNAYAGEKRRICGTCCGTGHRRDVIGQSQVHRRFATDLFAEVQRRVALASSGMSRALSPL